MTEICKLEALIEVEWNVAISTKIENAVKAMGIAVERISGGDRYATNFEVLKKFAAGFDFKNIYLATGANYPDAIISILN